MGTPANGTVSIAWTNNKENKAKIEKFIQLIDELFELQGDWCETVAQEKFGDGFFGDFFISQVDVFEGVSTGEIQIEMESQKIQNLKWQMDRVKELFDRYSLVNFIFSADVQTTVTYIHDDDTDG